MFPLRLHSGHLLVDNSTITEITMCPRKGAYKYLCGRQLRKNRAALFFGGAIHRALEVRDKFLRPMIDNETRTAMVSALVDVYEDTDMDGDYRNLDYAIQTIDKYNDTYRFDPLKPILLPAPDGSTVPAVELPFALPLGAIHIGQTLSIIDKDQNDGKPFETFIDELPIVFTGKIDRIPHYQGQLVIMDHKTTSMGGPTFFDEFYVSLQFKGYKWAAEQLIGERIAGVVINGMVCRPPKADGSVNYSFDRHYIPISDDVVDEWKETFLLSVHEWLNQVIGQSDHPSFPERSFPMRTAACVTKYGKCEYFDVCMLPCEQRQICLSSGLYEDHSWSPLDDNAKPKDKKPEIDVGDLFSHLNGGAP